MEPSAGDDDLLVRAVRVLEALAGMHQPASLAAVVERARLPRSQVYRALRALQGAGFVDHGARRGYRIAARGLSLGSLLTSRPELRELARPVLVRLAEEAHAIASFHLRSGHDRVLVLAAAPSRREHLASAPASPVGERAPLVRGCSGRAILAHLAPGVVDAVLAENPEGADALRAELPRIARSRVALSYGDNHLGHHGIATPVLDPADVTPLGSISLSGDARRFDEPALLALTDVLQAAAHRLAPHLAALLGSGASSEQRALDLTPPTPVPGGSEVSDVPGRPLRGQARRGG